MGVSGCDEAGPGEPWVAQQKVVSTWSERGNAYLASAPSQRQDLDRQIAADGGGRPRQLGAFDTPSSRNKPATAIRRDAARSTSRAVIGVALR